MRFVVLCCVVLCARAFVSVGVRAAAKLILRVEFSGGAHRKIHARAAKKCTFSKKWEHFELDHQS